MGGGPLAARLYIVEERTEGGPHSRTLTSGKLDSTPNASCPASPPRRSGESLPEADCLQSVSGNSRVLDTLDTKLRVEAYYQSGSLSPAVEQLESGARHLFLALR